jgi:hypothetical protein
MTQEEHGIADLQVGVHFEDSHPRWL